MEIRSRVQDGVVILDLKGKLTFGGGDVKFREGLVAHLEQGHDAVLINMKDVKKVDSSGLGELLKSKATAAAKGAEIKLVNVDVKVYELLTMSRLVGVFDMFDEEAQALASFG